MRAALRAGRSLLDGLEVTLLSIMHAILSRGEGLVLLGLLLGLQLVEDLGGLLLGRGVTTFPCFPGLSMPGGHAPWIAGKACRAPWARPFHQPDVRNDP